MTRPAPRRAAATSAAIAAQRLGGGRAARGAAGVQRGAGVLARFRGRLPRIRPLKALTVAAFGVALVGIVANAMVFQRSSHPSPLFGLGRSVDGASDAAQRSAAALPPPPQPVPVEKTGTIPAAPAIPAAAPDPAPPVAAGVASKPAPVHHAAALHHEEAKPKPPAAAAAHPRPGRVETAKVEPKTEAKADPVAKLLAGTAHPAKTAPGATPHPHHRVAEKAPGDGATPAARTE